MLGKEWCRRRGKRFSERECHIQKYREGERVTSESEYKEHIKSLREWERAELVKWKGREWSTVCGIS